MLSVWGKNSKEKERERLFPLPSSPLDQRPVHRLLLLQRGASRKFHEIDGQNTRVQITRGRRLKRAGSNWVLRIPFILNGNQNEC